MESHCDFNVYFPNDEQLFMCYSYFFFDEMSIQILCSFFYRLVILMSFKSSSYILDASLFSDKWFINIFSQYVASLFIFLMISF